MKEFVGTFQRQAEGHELTLRFRSLSDAQDAAGDLVDFLLAGVRPRRSAPSADPSEPPAATVQGEPSTPPAGPLAADLDRDMGEHGYSEQDMARMLNVCQTTVNRWRNGGYLPTGKARKALFRLLYAQEGGPQ